MSICEIVQRAIAARFLTVEAEDLLRQQLRIKYGPDDFTAFIRLQMAVLDGCVAQESRQQQPLRTRGQQVAAIAG